MMVDAKRKVNHFLDHKTGGILATLGVEGFKALRRDRRAALEALRQPDDDPLPRIAHSRMDRLLERLELVVGQIAVVEKAATP